MNTQGKAFKYPDNVDTDVIIPARYLNSSDPAELATHCMEDIDKDFTKKVQAGDIMVAGYNFGCGSSREHAPIAIKESGISVVIARSFADRVCEGHSRVRLILRQRYQGIAELQSFRWLLGIC